MPGGLDLVKPGRQAGGLPGGRVLAGAAGRGIALIAAIGRHAFGVPRARLGVAGRAVVHDDRPRYLHGLRGHGHVIGVVGGVRFCPARIGNQLGQQIVRAAVGQLQRRAGPGVIAHRQVGRGTQCLRAQ